MERSFEKIKIDKLPEGDNKLNEYSDHIREILDDIDYLKAAIAVEKDIAKKMELTSELENSEEELISLKNVMYKRKEQLDMDKGKSGNA